MNKISFIGYGHIAKAIAKSVSHDPRYQLYAAAPSLPVGINSDGVNTHHHNLAIIPDSDLVILAVKPDQMRTVLLEIKDTIPHRCVLLSVAAGLNLSWLAKHCIPHQPIVRSMPNIAAAVCKGATPLMANASVSLEQQSLVTDLLTHSGIITWLTHESDMDILTALSGSGPAYVLLFLEAMADAAVQLGLSKEVAHDFALQTMMGTSELARGSDLTFGELRKTVTSPKGTTASAIHTLQDQRFEWIIFNAMEAAYLRAKELGKENSTKD